MAEDLFNRLKATDLETLTAVVRQDQHSPEFKITNWAVEPLSNKGFGGSEGQFRFYGQGRPSAGEAESSWSVILKVQRKHEEELPPSHYFYWKRELLAAQSQWLDRLPGPVKAPRFYRAVEEAGFAWLWMEHVHDATSQPWTLKEYTFAANQLGEWHADYLTGIPQPNDPWLCKDHLRGWLGQHTPEEGWDDPKFSAHFSNETRTRHRELWADLESFLSALNHLPQVFSHFDFQRRNLFIRKAKNQQDELVAIDWALCGKGSIGSDLYHLVGISSLFFDFEQERVRELDAATFAAYLAGLRNAGWTGDVNQVRLGYCIWGAAYSGTLAPVVTAFFTSEAGRATALQSFGVAGEELLYKWSLIIDYCLDCADEARLLMKKLGVV